MATANWFDRGGEAYARFRPEYSPALAAYLAGEAPDSDRAVDVGCGTGQLTARLADHFGEVVGLDPSADQIANATPGERIRYLCAPAEALPLPDRSAALVTAAQAAHWFDLPAFYAEARRVAVDGAVLALVSYGVLRLDGDLSERFRRFYHEEVGPYWPPERRLVDEGYRTLDFPFAEVAAPALTIERWWALSDLLGYLTTWSAMRRLREAGETALLTDFADDLAAAWGDPAQPRPVSWQINMRIGRL